jgi:hypothetical protein
MTDIDLMAYAATVLVLTGWGLIAAHVCLRVWNGWLALKRAELELAIRMAGPNEPTALSAATRIDFADLKERIRKLEAIASGVDP